jgi:biopolymer transport protein TolQ
MNPADVAQSVLPLTSSDLSLFTLFWNAHWVVKTVMVGLLICSVWVWAIAIDKTVLYTRSRRAMDRFEQAFWSGQSLDELYRALSSRPAHSMAALFVAAMREWKRSFEGNARAIGGLQMRIEKVMEVTIAREVERLERRLLVLATIGSAGPFVRIVRNRLGDHDELPIDRRVQKHLAGGRRARHRRSTFCDRAWTCRRHTSDDFL